MSGMSPLVRTRLRRIAALWLAWTAAGLFYVTQDSVPRLYRGEYVPWKYVFVGWMTGMYVCAAFTPALLWLGERWPIERRIWHTGLHFCSSVVFSVVSTAVETPLLMLLGVFPAASPPASVAAGIAVMLSFGIQGGVIRYWAVIALQAVYRSRLNARTREREAFSLKVQASELSRQLAAAQLNTLKMQLQPHFLFNTLGAIIVLIQRQRTAEAEAMVARLGDLLRLSLEDVDAQEVPLHRELEFLRLYLSIEEVRFKDRLRIRIAASADLSDALVPHMILQPLVENAVRHGLGQSEGGVTIDVTAAKRDGVLALIVSDDGPGMQHTPTEPTGIGLANTRSRLERLYGDSAAIVTENAAPHGVRVTVTMPLRISGEEALCG
jgi:two-component system, LytTR family, sensor kinase